MLAVGAVVISSFLVSDWAKSTLLQPSSPSPPTPWHLGLQAQAWSLAATLGNRVCPEFMGWGSAGNWNFQGRGKSLPFWSLRKVENLECASQLSAW